MMPGQQRQLDRIADRARAARTVEEGHREHGFPQSGAGSRAKFWITAIDHNYVTGKRVISIDSSGVVTVEDELTKIAMPSLLRRSTWLDQTDDKGVTYTQPSGNPHERRATKDATVKDQIIQPPYILFPDYAGDIIIAEFGIPGGTGVYVDGDELVWEDLNQDARFWFGVDA